MYCIGALALICQFGLFIAGLIANCNLFLGSFLFFIVLLGEFILYLINQEADFFQWIKAKDPKEFKFTFQEFQKEICIHFNKAKSSETDYNRTDFDIGKLKHKYYKKVERIKLKKKLKKMFQVGYFYALIGFIEEQEGHYQLAGEYYNLAGNTFLELKNFNLAGKFYKWAGDVVKEQVNKQKYYNKAIEAFRDIGETIIIAEIEKIPGIEKSTEEANDINELSEEQINSIQKVNDIKDRILKSYRKPILKYDLMGNKGFSFPEKISEYPKDALEGNKLRALKLKLSKKAIRLWSRSNNKKRIKSGVLYALVGFIDYINTYYSEACDNFHFAAHIFRDIDHYKLAAKFYSFAGDSALKAKKNSKSLRSYKRALESLRKINNQEEEIEILEEKINGIQDILPDWFEQAPCYFGENLNKSD